MNSVLRRLREDEVTTVDANTYSKMAGDFINDAKTIVEQAADWNALRERYFVIQVAADQELITLDNFGADTEILSVVNDTDNCTLEYRSKDWFDEKRYLNEPLSGSPKYYTFDAPSDDGETRVLVYPKNSKQTSFVFNLVARQDDLTADSDVLKVPSKPVIHLAVALLARERGETGGTSTAEYFAIAEKSLSDAIAIDAARHPEELIFRTI
jgi:hypothetical protein